MKTLLIVSTLFLSLPASAEFSVDCPRATKGSYVTLNDTSSEAWELVDTESVFGKKAQILNETGSRKNEIRLALDNGTSLKSVYTFSGGLSECQSEGTSENVRLSISQVSPTGEARPLERLSCSCASD